MSKTILIVDDNDDIRLMLRKSLEKVGYKVLVSASTVSAIEQLMDNDVNVIITDYRVGPIDDRIWMKFLARFFGDKKIITISGYELEEFGHTDVQYLSKPFTLESLFQKIES